MSQPGPGKIDVQHEMDRISKAYSLQGDEEGLSALLDVLSGALHEINSLHERIQALEDAH